MSEATKETYLTIEEMAEHVRLSCQTIRRYVLNREVPFHKIKKVIRFRLSEVERWIDCGGLASAGGGGAAQEGGLFDGLEAGGQETEAQETGANGGGA